MNTKTLLLAGTLALAFFGGTTFAYSQPRPNAIAKVKLNGKYGFINTKGEQVTPCIYDEIDEFSEGFAKVRKDRKYGFVNSSGELVIPCEYDVTMPPENLTGVARDWWNSEENNAGFSEGLAIVSKNGKYGYINTNGEVVIPFVLDAASSFHCSRARVKYKGRNVVTDKSGDVHFICNGYDVSDYCNGLAFKSVLTRTIDYDGWKQTEYSYALIDTEGNEIIPMGLYQDPIGMPASVSGLFDRGPGPMWLMVSGGKDVKYGCIDSLGTVIVPFEYDDYYCFQDGFVIVKKGNKYGVLNETGDTVIPCKYDDIPAPEDAHRCFSNVALFKDDAIRVVVNEKYGYVDKNGKEIISPKYLDAQAFSEGLAAVLDGKNKNERGLLWSYVDLEGKSVIKGNYYDVCPFNDGLAIVQAGVKDTETFEGFEIEIDKVQVIDMTGKAIFTAEDDTIPLSVRNNGDKCANGFFNGLAIIEKKGKYGYINKSGEIVIPSIYEEAGSFCCYQ